MEEKSLTEWTLKKPESEGWYWFTEKPGGDPVLTQIKALKTFITSGEPVRIYTTGLYVFVHGEESLAKPIEQAHGWWYGPISAPVMKVKYGGD